MSLKEFRILTLEEFEAVCKAWRERADASTHDAWERSRMMATIYVQSRSKKRIDPKKFFPLPWDKAPADPRDKGFNYNERKRLADAFLKKREMRNGRERD
jgi:hypothetical protein